jgi:HEAT repeat protein
MLYRFRVLALAALAALPSAAFAQDARSDSAMLAEGWALLAKGDAAGASLIASQQLQRQPNNAAAFVLAVDADMSRGGSDAGLATYEKWLGTRKLDDAYILRRVARTMLTELSGKQPSPIARLEALKALAEDGDLDARSALEAAAQSNGFGEARVLAGLGNERAVRQLIDLLVAMPGASKMRIIDALGDSGSKLAIAPLKTLLIDPNDGNRAAAAAALGRLGATEAIPALKPLLNDQMFTVKFKAAGALYRLGDSSGLSFLTELTRSEHATIRIGAASELASQPDASWQALVRSLANDPDPTVRLEAARLIAPYDLCLAKSVLDALMQDGNIGIREAASGVLVDRVASDLMTLRTLLHSGDPLVRAKAAGRLLELTR